MAKVVVTGRSGTRASNASVESVQLDHLLLGMGGAVGASLLAAWLGDSFWTRVAVWWSRW
jgi:hypothetical protein